MFSTKIKDFKALQLIEQKNNFQLSDHSVSQQLKVFQQNNKKLVEQLTIQKTSLLFIPNLKIGKQMNSIFLFFPFNQNTFHSILRVEIIYEFSCFVLKFTFSLYSFWCRIET
jgi:hypothetical protein